MASGWTDYWQKSTYTMKHNDLTDIGESDHHVRYSDDEALSVFQTNLEENPTDIATKAPTSSWAYDHENDASAHHAKYTDGEALSVFQTNLEENPTDIATKAPTSSWAYDHENNASAHHAKYTDGEALSVFQANLEANPTNGETGKAANSNWSYDHAANASAHHAKYTDGEALSVFQANLEANPTNGETGKSANSNWSYDHAANASAHHTKYTDAESRIVFTQNLEETPTDTVLKAPASSWAYDHENDVDAHHAKYTDAEAVSAVSTADDYIKNTGDAASGDYNFNTGLLVIDSQAEKITITGSPGIFSFSCTGTGKFQGGTMIAAIIEGGDVTQDTIYDGIAAVIGSSYSVYHCNGALYHTSAYFIWLNHIERISSTVIRLHGMNDSAVNVYYDCEDGSSTTVIRITLVM